MQDHAFLRAVDRHAQTGVRRDVECPQPLGAGHKKIELPVAIALKDFVVTHGNLKGHARRDVDHSLRLRG